MDNNKTEWVISAERQKARNKKHRNREEECLQHIYSRTDTVKERISEFEDRSIEVAKT